MGTHRLLSVVFMMILAMATAGAARAAPPAEDADALTDKARELYLEGEQLYKKRDYERARAAYLAAWALRKHYQIAGNLGDCEVKLGRYRDAAEHLSYALRESAKEGVPLGVEKGLYEQAKAKVGMLEITVSEPDAVVLVDRVVVGTAPLPGPVFVEPGAHTIEARLGMKLAKVDISIEMGASRAVPLSPQAAAVEDVLREPKPEPVNPPLPPRTTEEGGPERSVVIAGGVGAGVVLGLAVVATVVANGKAGDAKEIDPTGSCQMNTTALGPEQCTAADDLRTSSSTWSNVAFWSFLGAGAVGAATVAYAVLAPRASEARTGVRITPVAGMRGGGLSVAVTW